MSKYTESLLRSYVDPSGQLPYVDTTLGRVWAGGQEKLNFTAADSEPIGSARVTRLASTVGSSALRIDELNLKGGANFEPFRYASMISLLAISADERRMLVSVRSKSQDEVMLWYKLMGNGLASIDGHVFTRRPETESGQAVFEGRAFAVPVTEL